MPESNTRPTYTKVAVSEQQLEDLVRQYMSKIEDGLVYVDHQLWTEAGGRLDVLMADSGRAFVVAELKVVEDDGMLLQALDYYDYVSSHIEAFARLYTDKVKGLEPDPTQPVRLFLIAPSFSQALINRCRWVDAPISLFSFTCLEVDGTKGILPVFSEQSIPSRPYRVEVRRSSDHVEYITDPAIRDLATGLLSEVSQWLPDHVVLDSIKYAISMKVNGSVFAYFVPYRKYFVISTYNADHVWSDYRIKNGHDVETLRPVLRAAMDRCASRTSAGRSNGGVNVTRDVMNPSRECGAS